MRIRQCCPRNRHTPAGTIPRTRRFFRYLLVVAAWIFLASVVAQVYFAGLMMFGQEGGRDLHVATGYTLATAGVLFLILPALARTGARTIVLGAILAVATFFQPTLTYARDDAPLVAALHPLNALLIFTLALIMVRRATQLLAAGGSVTASTEGEAGAQAVL